jgi:hypothetical protein
MTAPQPGIKFVQLNDATSQLTLTKVTVTYTAAQGAGDLNVVIVGWNDTTYKRAGLWLYEPYHHHARRRHSRRQNCKHYWQLQRFCGHKRGRSMGQADDGLQSTPSRGRGKSAELQSCSSIRASS